jgi:hypothetical protein
VVCVVRDFRDEAIFRMFFPHGYDTRMSSPGPVKIVTYHLVHEQKSVNTELTSRLSELQVVTDDLYSISDYCKCEVSGGK